MSLCIFSHYAGLVFNETFYLENNPDVKQAVQNRKFSSGHRHFSEYGKHENRKHEFLPSVTPKYINVYLKELSKHFGKVILVSNAKVETNFPVVIVENEGYDFGMWKKVLKNVGAENRIALVNDSVVLFNTLDHIFKWAESNKSDFWGLTDSRELAYHIQSYFMVFEMKAVSLLLEFFKNYVIDNVRKRTIMNGELGLSRFMMNNGMNLKAFVSMGGVLNPHFHHWKQLIESGVPIIKKKIVIGHKDLPRVDYNNWHLVVQKHMKWEYNDIFSYIGV
jgi:hypothetical protein